MRTTLADRISAHYDSPAFWDSDLIGFARIVLEPAPPNPPTVFPWHGHIRYSAAMTTAEKTPEQRIADMNAEVYRRRREPDVRLALEKQLFTVKPEGPNADAMAAIHAAALELAVTIELWAPANRNRSIALTAVEDAQIRGIRALFEADHA